MSISGRKKVLVVLGPTASGKSMLAVGIATWLKRHGQGAEVISADSRQVYRGLDVATCKITRREMRGVPHHLLDVASPRRQFSPARYKTLAQRALRDILRRGKLAIICGGSGQYIDALLGVHPIPSVPPDTKLRAKLEKFSAAELFAQLRKLDPRRAKTIDRHNPRRLIRAIEIVTKTGKPVPILGVRGQELGGSASYSLIRANRRIVGVDVLKIGLNPSPDELRRRINARLTKDLRRGLIAEVKQLRNGGLSWKRLDELGLEYRLVAQFIRGEIETKQELLHKLQTEIWRYTKRQIRWWKRDTDIRWGRNEREGLRIAQTELRR